MDHEIVAVEIDPARYTRAGEALPCARVAGEYLLRFRAVHGQWMICHDTWSLRAGICVSCPQARECDGGIYMQ